MPQGNPSAFGGLARGLDRGIQYGLLVRQMQQQNREIEDREFSKLIEVFKYQSDIAGNKKMPIGMRQFATDNILKLYKSPIVAKKLGYDVSKLPERIDVTKMDDALVDYNKKAQEILGGKLKQSDSLLAINSLNREFMGQLEQDELLGMAEAKTIIEKQGAESSQQRISQIAQSGVSLPDIAMSAQSPEEVSAIKELQGVQKEGKKEPPTLDRRIQSEIERLGLTGSDALSFQIKKTAEATGAKAAAAQEAKPIPAEQIRALSELEVLDKMAHETGRLFKNEYVGKVDAIEGFVREFTGNISDDEVVFRKNTLDMQDALLRARSGAQINEQEYQRLRRFLPKLSDQGNVYMAALKRFNKEVQDLLAEKMKLSTMSRGELKSGKPTQKQNPQQKDPLGIR